MKDFLGSLGNDSKFNTLVKLAFYSLFVFGAIILINTADLDSGEDETDSVDNNSVVEGPMIDLPNNYDYKYSISIDSKIYSYQGMVVDNVNTFKKNEDNKIIEYKYEDKVYYQLEKEEYVVVSEQEVYNIVDNKYLDIEKINHYLDNSIKENDKYYTYLKDAVTGEATDTYIEIEFDENKISIDYSKLEDEYKEFTVTFEYEERKV